MASFIASTKKIAFAATLLQALWHFNPTSSVVSAAETPVQLHGLNYNPRQGPDWDSFRCKSREQIVTDLTLLKRLTNRIRILSLTDCDGGIMILDVVKELDMQIWLGLWVAAEDVTFAGEKGYLENMLAQGLITESTVLGITVGSEAIYRGDVTVSKNIDDMNQVKDLMVDAGFENLPVTVVDIVQTYYENPILVDAVDVLYANIFPFWAGIPLENSIPHLMSELDILLSLDEAQGKKFIFGETGWPSDGLIEGVQPGSVEGQVGFFEQFYCEMALKGNYEYFYFTGIDNAWRQIQDPNNSIEGNWGILNADLTVKPHFEDLVFQCDDSTEHSFAAIDWTIPDPSSPTTTTTPAPVVSSSPTAVPTIATPSPTILETGAPSSATSTTMAPSSSSSTTSTPTQTATPAPTKTPAPEDTTPSPVMGTDTAVPTLTTTSSITPSSYSESSSPLDASGTVDIEASGAHNAFLNNNLFASVVFAVLGTSFLYLLN